MPTTAPGLKKFTAKDPSRTIMLRKTMIADMTRRMTRIRQAVYKLVAIDDAFGLRDAALFTSNTATLTVNTKWQFLTDKAKVTEFQSWLKTLTDTELLSSDNAAAPWTDKYVASAYKQGLKRGYIEGKPATRRPSNFTEGTVAQFLDESFGSAESVKKLELLGTRTFLNLKGITTTMDQQLSNVLVQGLAEGKAPGAIAKMMTDQIDGLTRGRAATIARTEIIHAHAEGQLDGFAEAGLNDVIVMAEWATAEDAKVCSRCAPLQGVVFTIEEARGIIPRHPNCRCAWLPAAVGEETTGQAWAQRQARILDSVKAETGLDDGAEARAASRWLGADKKLPSSIANLKPKQSALKEMKADEFMQAQKELKLKKAQAKAAADAAAKAKQGTNIKLGLAKRKLDGAGIPVDLTEFGPDGVTDALATKILTTEQGLLYTPEELIAIVTDAKAQDGPAQQVAFLLQQRDNALQAARKAAKAAAQAEAALAEQAAAKAATQALTGLGEAAFTEGKLTVEALDELADQMAFTPSQLRALSKATTATEEAAVLADIVPKAKQATEDVLQAASQKYGTPPTWFKQGTDGEDWLDMKWAVSSNNFTNATEYKEWVAWSADAVDAIDTMPNPAKKLKAYEALVDTFKKEQQAAAAAKRALELGTLDDQLAVAGSDLTYKELKATIKSNIITGESVLTKDATKAVDFDDLVAAIARAGNEAKAVNVGEELVSAMLTTKKTIPFSDLMKAVKGMEWDQQVLLVRYKGKLIVMGNEAGVQAAKFAKIDKLTNVWKLDLDEWYAGKQAGKAAKEAQWATTGAKAKLKDVPDLFSDWSTANVMDDSPLLMDTTFTKAEFQAAIADAKAAGVKAEPEVMAVADLYRLDGEASIVKVDQAFDYAQSVAPGDDPWPGIEGYQWQGKIYLNKNVATAEAAKLAGVENVMVNITDLDSVVLPSVTAAPTPKPVNTLLDLVGGPPKPGTIPTVSQFKAGLDSMDGVATMYEGGEKVATIMGVKNVMKGLNIEALFDATSAAKQKELGTLIQQSSKWHQQWAIAKAFEKTGAAVRFSEIHIIDQLHAVTDVNKLVGASNKFTAAGLKKVQKALGVSVDEGWAQLVAKDKINVQLQKIKALAPNKFPSDSNVFGLPLPDKVNDPTPWIEGHVKLNEGLYTKWGYKPGDQPSYSEFNKKMSRYFNGQPTGVFVSWDQNTPLSLTLEKLEAYAQKNPTKLKAMPLGGAGVGPVQKVTVPKGFFDAPAAVSELPDFGKIKVIKNLPGSTAPQLVEHTTDGSKWVMKAGLDPGHVKSEALADDLYRRLGLNVPKSGIVETSGGPVKFSEFLDGGKTLQEFLRTATNAERADALKQVKAGFVADALFANHDVAGLSMDNLFVAGGKVYRIDNGGALLYRAQGAAKRDFGAAVKELASMRDKGTNSVTAELFGDLTDSEIHDQIRDIVSRRDKLLEGVADAKLRKVLGERIDWLKAQLPPDTTSMAIKVHTAATKTPAVYEVTPEAIARTKASRINGVNFSADKDLVEDQNLLIWEEAGADGKPVTRAVFKLTQKGSDVMTQALPSTKLGLVPQAANKHPDDDFFTQFTNAAKTVNTHVSDGNYNAGTLAAYNAKKVQLQSAINTATDPVKKAMLQHYVQMADDIDTALANKGTVNPKWKMQFEMPKAEPTRRRVDTYRVAPSQPGDRLNNITKGHGRAAGTEQRFSIGNAGAYDIETDDGVRMNFVPSKGSNGGSSYGGRVAVTVDGPVTPETIQKLRESMAAVGVDVGAATPAAEEALYIHKTVYLRGLHNDAAYKTIWDDPDDAARVVKLKAWVKQKMGIDLPDKPTEDYNPAGRAASGFGDGFRVWDRWDTPRAAMKKELAGYNLAHYTRGLYESKVGAVPDLVEALMNTGGEMTSTMSRVRKGISVRGTGGGSPEPDMASGGADYVFTRLSKKGDKTRGQRGLFFKPENAARADVIHYDDDYYGRTTRIDERKRTVSEMKQASLNSSNELIFKHSLSIIYDVDTIGVYTEAEKARVVAAYKQAGFAVLPDGRKIEDIVEVR